MAKFVISGIRHDEWEVEADNYRVDEDFFHFYSAGGEQLLAVRKDTVLTVRSSKADQQ